MITTRYVEVWMLAKKAMRRLRHPALTSEHLFYACLRVNDQRHWDLCKDLPVTAEAVWSHLRENPAWSETSEEFYSVPVGASAKAALERAEVEASECHHGGTGTNALMRALLAETHGPVRSLLEGARTAALAARREDPDSSKPA